MIPAESRTFAAAALLCLAAHAQLCAAFVPPSSAPSIAALLPSSTPIIGATALSVVSGPDAAAGFVDAYVHGQYSFMLPTATLVATSCQLAGIGGAALFSPIFLLAFPLLGPTYPLESAAAALASALLTECFGFASGLAGYARRGLVDWEVAGRYLVCSVPTAVAGALTAKYVAASPILLQCLYATLMLGLASYLILAPRPEEIAELAADEECTVEAFDGTLRDVRFKTAADGTEFGYLSPPDRSTKSVLATAAGGSLTGLLGVGIGEVILPQLVRGCCMPLPVAAGTSVCVVVTTALTAAAVQFVTLASSLDGDGTLVEGLVRIVPWSLVQYTVPGVLVGGQLAPFLASRGEFSDEDIERFAAALFAVVGVSFAVKAGTSLLA